AIYNVTRTKFQMKTFSFSLFVAFPFLLIISFVISDFLNKNSIGAYSFFLSFVSLIYIIGYSKNLKISHIMLILFLARRLIFASDSRSIFLSISFSFLTYFSWNFI